VLFDDFVKKDTKLVRVRVFLIVGILKMLSGGGACWLKEETALPLLGDEIDSLSFKSVLSRSENIPIDLSLFLPFDGDLSFV